MHLVCCLFVRLYLPVLQLDYWNQPAGLPEPPVRALKHPPKGTGLPHPPALASLPTPPSAVRSYSQPPAAASLPRPPVAASSKQDAEIEYGNPLYLHHCFLMYSALPQTHAYGLPMQHQNSLLLSHILCVSCLISGRNIWQSCSTACLLLM